LSGLDGGEEEREEREVDDDDFGLADMLGEDEDEVVVVVVVVVLTTGCLFSRRGTWRASTCQDRASEKAAAWSDGRGREEVGVFFIAIGCDWATLLRPVAVVEVAFGSETGAITTRAVPEALTLEMEMVASTAAAAAVRRLDSSAAVALERRRAFSTLYASSASLWAVTNDC
jgi:hypothetical protein